MDRAQAMIVVLVFYVAPLLHVAFAPGAGSLRPPPGSRCPMGPRLGWIVMVLMLGPVGWLMFIARRRRPAPPTAPAASPAGDDRSVGVPKQG
ncbi:MAG TPA: hypothetical protein VF342_12740 [Alphaproteobacteria bacterium]